MLEYQEALQAISKGPHHPVYILIGADYILCQRMIQQICLHQPSEADVSEITRYSFEDEGCDAALLACQTLSFFGVPVVVLQNCTAFLAASKSSHPTTELEAYLEHPIPDRTLIITIESEKWDERKKLTKLAKKLCVIRCHVDKEEAALRILRDICSQSDYLIQTDALQELWRRTGSISLANVELRKLHAFTSGQRIEMKDVQALVSPPVDDNVFAWIDSVVKGDVKRAFALVQGLIQAGNDPIGLIALIARQLRLIWFAKVLSGKGVAEAQIASKAGAHPYAVKVALGQSRRFTAQRIEQLMKDIADAEYLMKTGRQDLHHALVWIVMSCAVTTVEKSRAK